MTLKEERPKNDKARVVVRAAEQETRAARPVHGPGVFRRLRRITGVWKHTRTLQMYLLIDQHMFEKWYMISKQQESQEKLWPGSRTGKEVGEGHSPGQLKRHVLRSV